MTVAPLGKLPLMSIKVSAFDCEINESADVFIGTIGIVPYLFVVLPSSSFKVRLSQGNLRILRSGVEDFLITE